MNNLIKTIFGKSFVFNFPLVRSITTTSFNRLKQIELVEDNGTLTVKGKIIQSGREALLLPEVSECRKNGQRFCPECTLKLNIKHTDVLILSQYVRPDGCMLPRRVTGLCKRQQKRIGTLVTMAHKAGLMPNMKPSQTKRAPEQRSKYKKFNTYFLEHTIKLPKSVKKEETFCSK